MSLQSFILSAHFAAAIIGLGGSTGAWGGDLDRLSITDLQRRLTLPADYKGDGENLLSALQGGTAARTRPILWHWTGKGAEPDYWPRLAVRDADWKLVMTADQNVSNCTI